MLRLVIVVLPAMVAPCIGRNPIDVGDRKQLFIDSRFIAKSGNVELRANPAQKMGRISNENDEVLLSHVGRVLEDNGKIRLYIGADDLTVLESEDGIHLKGVRSIPNGVLPTIYQYPRASDPAKKYKLFRVQHGEPFDRVKNGEFAHFSADGLNPTKAGRVLPYYTDNPQIVWWDTRINKYVIYVRALGPDSENERRIARTS